jgi:RNA polymerase sigma-70 factor (ECF subfamily)
MDSNLETPTLRGIIAEYGAYIHRALHALRVLPNDVPDVSQEVLRAVDRGLPRFDRARAVDPENAVRSWLIAICQRQARSYHRQRRLLLSREALQENAELDLRLCDGPDNEEAFVTCETRSRLVGLLEELLPEQRALVVAYELEETAMDELAIAYRIPVNTAWNRLRLAREALRQAFRRRR